jgi:hypothetical protein
VSKVATDEGQTALALARVHRARGLVLEAATSEPRTIQELRRLVAAELGEHGARNVTAAALRELKDQGRVWADAGQRRGGRWHRA